MPRRPVLMVYMRLLLGARALRLRCFGGDAPKGAETNGPTHRFR